MKKLLALSMSFLLVVALGSMAFASPKQATEKTEKKTTTEKKVTTEKKTAAKARQFTGDVTNWTDTEVTVERKAGKAAPKSETFTINADTKKPDTVKVGDHVTVHYKDMNGKKVATKITTAAAKGGMKKQPAAKKSS